MHIGRRRPHPLRRTIVWLGAALLGIAVPTAALATPSIAASVADTVSVNATDGLGQIPSNAIGLNTAVYDGRMNDAPIPGLLKAAGIDALRYPGGSYSDIYNWQTNTAQGGYDAPDTSFADFMTTAQASGANPIITVNYGTGTPALASAWVQNANVTNNYGINYWEVGNEVYGNGTYGANWEADAHCTDASGNPVTVGSAAVADLQLRACHLREERAELPLRDEGGEPEQPRVRGADHRPASGRTA